MALRPCTCTWTWVEIDPAVEKLLLRLRGDDLCTFHVKEADEDNSFATA